MEGEGKKEAGEEKKMERSKGRGGQGKEGKGAADGTDGRGRIDCKDSIEDEGRGGKEMRMKEQR